MAERPKLPKGQGGGTLSDAMSSLSSMVGSMSGQLVSISSLQSDIGAWADLWLEQAQRSIDSNELLMQQLDILVDTNRLTAENTFNSAKSLAEMSQSLGVIKEFLAPISAHFAELLEETPMRDWPDSQRVVVPQAAPGAVGDQLKEQQMPEDKKAGAGAIGFFGGLFGKGVGGAIGAFFAKIGVGLGIFGIGLAAITGALFLGAKAVETFGEGLSDIAKGIEDLNKVEVDTEQFNRLGEALGALVGGVGVGGATGVLILAKTDFVNLAEGIERLNKAEFDPANLEAAGQAIGDFLSGMASFGSLVGGTVAGMVDDNLIPLAEGIERLNRVQVDDGFKDRLSLAGEGIGGLIDGIGTQFLDAGTLQMIDDNLVQLAQGISDLNKIPVSDDFKERLSTLGQGVGALLDGIGGWTGNMSDAAVLAMIDDNLIPLAQGIKELNTVDSEKFLTVGRNLGSGLQSLLDGTDDVAGAAGLQMIDDNLIDLTKGINSLNTVDSSTFRDKTIELGAGFQALLDGTDDVVGATGLQMIDDNLIDLTAGINALNSVDAALFFTKAQSLGLGFKEILTPFTLFSMQDIREMGEFSHKLKEVGTALTSLNNIDETMLAPVAEVMKYATDLLSGTGIKEIGVALTQVNDAARNLSDEGDFPEDFDNFEKFVDKLKILETLNIDRLSRLGVAMAQISGAASSLVSEESIGRQQSLALANARTANEVAQSPVVNVTTDNSVSSVQQNNVRGGGGAVARASVSSPVTPSKNVFV